MITVERISKRFKIYPSPSSRLKEIVFRRSCHKIYTSLDDVSFTVEDGETLGIIGPNGSGKTTLLKLLSGILIPDTGSISITGKVTGLLELGTGFHPEMTGRENIYMNGLLLGMEKDEIKEKEERIIQFTEIEYFIDNPLKTFSSGMVMRLAFAIAYHAEPSCFFVDEALSVGDAHFQQKCMKAIERFKEQGGSILFVSHDMNAIKMLSDKVILLSHGRVIEEGDPEKVVNSYNFLLTQEHDEEFIRKGISTVNGSGARTDYGTKLVRITDVSVTGAESRGPVLMSGEYAEICVSFLSEISQDELTVGILIRDRFGQDIFGTNTFHAQVPVSCEKNKKYVCRFSVKMDLGPGKYTVTAALHTGEAHIASCFNWKDRAADFEVAGVKGVFFTGVSRLEPKIQFFEMK